MDTLTITLTNPRVIDGLVFGANSSDMTPEAFGELILNREGSGFANNAQIGILTSAAFVGRFSPSEYAAIIAAAETEPQIASLVSEVMGSAFIYLDDPRLDPGLDQLEAAGLIAAGRKAEILEYDRPVPQVTP